MVVALGASVVFSCPCSDLAEFKASLNLFKEILERMVLIGQGFLFLLSLHRPQATDQTIIWAWF